MISKQTTKSIPLRSSQFSFTGISLTSTEPKRFEVSLSFPGVLYSHESTLTGNQLFSYSEFQNAIAVDHGVIPYVPEIDQARGTHKRSQLWRSVIASFSPELV